MLHKNIYNEVYMRQYVYVLREILRNFESKIIENNKHIFISTIKLISCNYNYYYFNRAMNF